MAFKEERGILGKIYDFIGSAAFTGAAVAAAGSVAAIVFSLGYGLGGAAGLGAFPSVIIGGIATFVAATPVVLGGVVFGAAAAGIGTVLGNAIGLRPSGLGVTAGIGLGLGATFSMISNMTSREPDVDSMLKNTEPYSVAEMDNANGVLSEQFTSTGKQVIAVNDQFFTVGAPKTETVQHFQP